MFSVFTAQSDVSTSHFRTRRVGAVDVGADKGAGGCL